MTYYFVAAGGIWQFDLGCHVKIYDAKANKFIYDDAISAKAKKEYTISAGYSTDYSARDRIYAETLIQLGSNSAASYTQLVPIISIRQE